MATSNNRTARRVLRKTVRIGALALLAGTAIFCAAGLLTRLPGEAATALGPQRNEALYVRMSDGTLIAIDIWYPPTLKPGERIPALMHMTRYWRAHEVTFAHRALYGLGLMARDGLLPDHADIFNRRGYAVVQIDARGSGASFGSRIAELGPDEIRDYGEIADWIVRQRWSNGRIGTFGISYNGNAAELALAAGHPAIRAASPQFSDFDFQLGVLQPGGVTMDFVPLWSDLVMAMDRNDICGAQMVSGWRCRLLRLTAGGAKPVDGPQGRAQLRDAIAQHKANRPLRDAFANVHFRDDRYGGTNLTIAQLNAYGHKTAIEASGAPMQPWLGWFDAGTVNGALSRFATFSNPQDVIIGPFAHGGGHDIDPFLPEDAPPRLSPAQQYERVATFFDAHLKEGGAGTARHRITYYTMGKRRWCRTATWPPAGTVQTRFSLAPNRALSTDDAPNAGSDRYVVDFTHSTGARNRWMTNLDYGDVVYGDRTAAQKTLLSYSTAPLPTDMIVTGSAQLLLYLASSEPDYALHAYLEAVAPDGRALHVAESILRSANHPLSAEPNPSDIFGPKRSYRRQDARLPEAGRTTAIALGFTPVSMLIPKGYRLRLSLAGADRSIFPRHPARVTPVWTIGFGGDTPSRLTLPIEGPGGCAAVAF